MKKKIGILVGSLRKDSFNRMVAHALTEVAPESLSFEWIEIGQLSFFNQDLEDNPPKEWTDFRSKIASLDGVVFATPEYNRSVPAVLKNAIDVGSRPYGQSVWNNIPAAVISVSIGAIGGFGANHHLRQSLVFLNMPTMAQPEAYIGSAGELFDASGKLTNQDTSKFLKSFAAAFSDWVEKHPK